MVVDANGDIWALSVLCGGASCGATSVLFHIVDGVWTPTPDWAFSAFGGSNLFIDQAGDVWAPSIWRW